MIRVVDTSAIYALVDQADVHHGQARTAFAHQDPIEVPPVILVETVDLLSYRHGYALAQEAATTLLELPQLCVTDSVMMEPVLRIYQEAQGRLSLADAVVVQTCRVLGAAPLTFDEEILKWCDKQAG